VIDVPSELSPSQVGTVVRVRRTSGSARADRRLSAHERRGAVARQHSRAECRRESGNIVYLYSPPPRSGRRMRAVRYHEYGGPEVLRVDEVDRPEPAADEVLIEVAGAGANPVDTYFREGAYEPFALPMITGVDAAGEAAAVGAAVEGIEAGDSEKPRPSGSRPEAGDAVVATGLTKDHYGTCAEYVAVPTDRVVKLPDSVDPVAAGGAGVAAVTAWRALIDHAGLEPAETALVHGGSGGVGHAAVQLAAAGARVVTTAAPEYHDRLETLGADAVLDYARDDLRDAVVEASGGGPDAILDHRLDDYLQFDADVAAHGARIVGIGENDPAVGFTNDGAARGKELTYQFMSMYNTPDLRRPLAGVATLLGDGELDIEVARTYDLDDVAQAQRDVLNESFLGKLVVTP
jgi:NADPH:quinone reductase-like Zn-dependent oxidoreductase